MTCCEGRGNPRSVDDVEDLAGGVSWWAQLVLRHQGGSSGAVGSYQIKMRRVPRLGGGFIAFAFIGYDPVRPRMAGTPSLNSNCAQKFCGQFCANHRHHGRWSFRCLAHSLRGRRGLQRRASRRNRIFEMVGDACHAFSRGLRVALDPGNPFPVLM